MTSFLQMAPIANVRNTARCVNIYAKSTVAITDLSVMSLLRKIFFLFFFFSQNNVVTAHLLCTAYNSKYFLNVTLLKFYCT